MSPIDMQVPPYSTAGTRDSVVVETQVVVADKDSQPSLGRRYTAIPSILNRIMVGGVLIAYANLPSAAQHNSTVSVIMPSTDHRAGDAPVPDHDVVGMESPLTSEDRVYSPDYDYEVIFTATHSFNADNLPELEPQIRAAHLPVF